MNTIRRSLRAGIVIAAIAAVAAAQAQEKTNYAELARIARTAQTQAFAEKMQAQALALRLGMPIRRVDPKTNQVVQVMRVAPNGMPVYYATRNLNAGITTRANRVYSGGGAGLSLTGSGVVFGVWDGGDVRSTHQELTGRVTVHDSEYGLGEHGTHVAGTIMATGVATLNTGPGGSPVANAAKGMSFQGTLRSYDWDEDVAEVAAEAGSGTPVFISNHSYGPYTGWVEWSANNWYWFGWTADSQTEDSVFGRYSSQCAQFDAIAFNAPNNLMVWSAGNDRGEGPASGTTHQVWDPTANGGSGGWVASNTVRPVDGGAAGFDCVSGVGVAKNVMCVGAVDDVLNYTGPGSVVMSSFSAFGPADDGRIKPDVVGNGINLASTGASANNAYYYSSGTSMASPNIAGSMGLLVQHYRNTHSSQNMRSSMLRGLVIHTADEAGATTGPDYKFGWGLMDTEAAAKVISDDQTNPDVMRDFTLTPNGTNTFYATSDGTAPLKFSICWTDPAGTSQSGNNNRTARLVHDLDMTVTKGATTYSPYCLSYSSPSAAATTGDNNVDNVEVIEIPAPSAGTYQITINHDGTLSANQAYSLIVTGTVVNPMMTFFAINGMYLTGRNSTNGTVTINTAAPAGGFKVYPRSTPAGIVNITSPVIIPEGQTSKTFTIVGAGDVPTNTTYSVWVDAGLKTLGQTGTLIPLKIKTMTIPASMAAGSNGTLTVTLNGPAQVGGTTLTIQRAPTYWINAATTLVIPQGQFSGSIPISIKPGVASTMTGQFRVIQNLQFGGQAQLDKSFTITP